MANITEDTDLILEAALKDAFSALAPSSRPQSLKPIPKPEPVSDEYTTATTTTTTSEEEESVDAVALATETQTDAENTVAAAAATDTMTETPNVEVEVPQEQEQERVEESTKDTDGDTWKSEYEEQVKAWRAQSSEAREKAEKVREQWEAVRAAEREEAERRKAAGIVDVVDEVVEEIIEVEVEVTSSPVEVVEENKAMEDVEEKEEEDEKEEVVQEEGVIIDIDDSPSPPDARDEPEGQYTVESSVMLSRVQSRVETETSSQKWEEINSSETSSSYPSLSFPERTLTPSPFNDSHSNQHRHHHQEEQEPTAATTATVGGGGRIEPQTTTLAIFDSSLSTSTRLKALASSLSINLLLPFINGVMLGFGEIFAKNVVMKWFGWGSTVANVGLSSSSSRQQRSFNKPRF